MNKPFEHQVNEKGDKRTVVRTPVAHLQLDSRANGLQMADVNIALPGGKKFRFSTRFRVGID